MQLQLGSKQLLVEHLQVLHNLLVAPVKNPPVAISTTKQRSASTFLSLVSLTFLLQLVIIGRQGIISGVRGIISGSPWGISGAPEIISSPPEIISGRPEIISGVPELVSGTPGVVSGAPEIIPRSPEMSPRGGCLSCWNRFVANLCHSLNIYPLFQI